MVDRGVISVRIIDLSQEIYHNCPVPPGFSPPSLQYLKIGARDGWTVEQITMSLHTATHMDAPAHLADYSETLDQIAVDRFQGKMVLIPLHHKLADEPITMDDLKPYVQLIHPESILLLYIGWGEKRGWTKEFIYHSPYLSNEAARWLAVRKVRGVGIDHFSIGGVGAENEETHRILLGAGIWIAEGLQLDHPALRIGSWHVMALPVKIKDSSGAPARVVALQWERLREGEQACAGS